MAPSELLSLAVIDDDDDVRTALSRLLRAMGHQVRLFATAEEFEAADVQVACVIADVRLPGLSGLELRDRLRNRPEPVPILLITGDGDRLVRDIGLTTDTPLLTKPFDAADLIEAIASAMSLVAIDRGPHAN